MGPVLIWRVQDPVGEVIGMEQDMSLAEAREFVDKNNIPWLSGKTGTTRSTCKTNVLGKMLNYLRRLYGREEVSSGGSVGREG